MKTTSDSDVRYLADVLAGKYGKVAQRKARKAVLRIVPQILDSKKSKTIGANQTQTQIKTR